MATLLVIRNEKQEIIDCHFSDKINHNIIWDYDFDGDPKITISLGHMKLQEGFIPLLDNNGKQEYEVEIAADGKKGRKKTPKMKFTRMLINTITNEKQIGGRDR